MSAYLVPLTLVTAIGSGLVAGMMYAFSTFIMQSFAKLKPQNGIEVMQIINRTILNPWFLVLFMGTMITSLMLSVGAVLAWEAPEAPLMLAGGLLYFIGMFMVTAVFNVPMNDALEATDANSEEGAQLWQHYLIRWTFWNHVRTAAAIACVVVLMLVLI